MGVKFSSLLDYTHTPESLDGQKLTHTWGLDSASRFLNLSVGMRKQLSTVGGDPKGMSVDVSPTSICTLVGPPNLTDKVFGRTGFITLEGVAEGDAEIKLLDAGGKTVDKIAIKVVKARTVKVRFYNMVDGKGRQGVRDPDTDADFKVAAFQDLVFALNSIVGLQCDVFMSLTGLGALRNLTFSADLGNRVNIDEVNPFSSSDLDPDAQFHVAFVWGISGGHANGITKSNFSLLQAGRTGTKREVTLCHEFVHFLSGGGIVRPSDHDDQPSDLMFKTAPHGINMRKARLEKIIHG
jgi:hypothetical protein